MTHVSIIGTGSMGQAIAQVFTKGGATVDLVARGDSTPLTGDVVVLALPYAAVADVITQRADELSGKVVVDITNPLDFTTFDSLDVPADSSATATIAAALPSSRVVKAFNTTFATTLTSGVVGQATTTVLLAGDDVDAKALVSVLVTAAGLAAIDAGSLRRARELEALGFLQITLAASEKVSWAGGFAVIA